MAERHAVDDFTRDSVYAGNVTLIQPKVGFRANVDSLILSSSVEVNPKEKGLEVGAGCGGVSLPLAYRCSDARLTCIDIDPQSVHLARMGAQANGFEDRLNFETTDVMAFAPNMLQTFDYVFSNPPYFKPGSICPPGEGKSDAYLNNTNLKDWVRACLSTLRYKGRFYMIHRAADVSVIMAALDGQAGQITLRPIASFSGKPAKRVLIRARKGLRRGDDRVLAPIFLHIAQDAGQDSQPSQTLLSIRSGAALDWH